MSSASVVVDPRMRSRRIEVLRESGRRRLKRVGILAGVLAVAGAGWAIVRSPLLDVDTVRVAGGEHTTGDAARYAAAIPQGEPLLTLDTGAVAERVEALPWVAEAHVSRQWPGAVRIELTERTPLAAAPFGGDRWAVLDGDGRVLSVDAAAPADLAAVVGLEAPVEAGDTVPAEARRAVQLLALLTERMPGTVTGVGTDLSATLTLGGTVRFGSLDDIDAKVVALQAVLADVDTSCLATLDVRVPSSPALTRNEGCP